MVSEDDLPKTSVGTIDFDKLREQGRVKEEKLIEDKDTGKVTRVTTSGLSRRVKAEEIDPRTGKVKSTQEFEAERPVTAAEITAASLKGEPETIRRDTIDKKPTLQERVSLAFRPEVRERKIIEEAIKREGKVLQARTSQEALRGVALKQVTQQQIQREKQAERIQKVKEFVQKSFGKREEKAPRTREEARSEVAKRLAGSERRQLKAAQEPVKKALKSKTGQEFVKTLKETRLISPSAIVGKGVELADVKIGGFLSSRKLKSGKTVLESISESIGKSRAKTKEKGLAFLRKKLVTPFKPSIDTKASQANSSKSDDKSDVQFRSQISERLQVDKLFRRQLELETFAAEKTKLGASLLGSGAITGVKVIGKEIAEKPLGTTLSFASLFLASSAVAGVATKGVGLLGASPKVQQIAGRIAPEVGFGVLTAVQTARAPTVAEKAEVLGTDIAFGAAFFGGRRILGRVTPRGQGKTVLRKVSEKVPSKIRGETSFGVVREIDEIPASTKIIRDGRATTLKDEFIAGKAIIDVAKPKVTTFASKDVRGIALDTGSQFTTQKVKVGRREFFIRTEVAPTGGRTTRVFKGDKELLLLEDIAAPTIKFTEDLLKRRQFEFIKSSSLFDDTPQLREFRGETEIQTLESKGVSTVPRKQLSKTVQLKGRQATIREQKRGIGSTVPGLEVFRSAKTAEVKVKDIGTEFEFVDFPTRAKQRVVSVGDLEIKETRPAEFISRQKEKFVSKFEIEAFVDESILGPKIKSAAKIKSKKAGLVLESPKTKVEVQRPTTKQTKGLGLVLTTPTATTTKIAPPILINITKPTPKKKQIPDIILKEVPVTKTKQKSRVKLKQLQETLLKSKAKQKTRLKTIQLTKTKQKQVIITKVKQIQLQKQFQKQLQLTRTRQRTTNINRFPLFAAPPIMPLLPRRKGKIQELFAVEVRRKGKFERLKGRFGKQTALSKGARKVTGTSAATFRLVSLGFGVGVGKKEDEFFKRKRGQFRRAKKGKTKSPIFQEFIEKRKFRIDTPGELRQITRKGIQARKGAL